MIISKLKKCQNQNDFITQIFRMLHVFIIQKQFHMNTFDLFIRNSHFFEARTFYYVQLMHNLCIIYT